LAIAFCLLWVRSINHVNDLKRLLYERKAHQALFQSTYISF
jgi:hypothetical protein